MWGLDQEGLKVTVVGMLRIPTLVGVKISNEKGLVVATGGIVIENGETGNVGMHVNLLGNSAEDVAVHGDELYDNEMFSHQFPIIYNLESENLLVGQAIIYSNSSVIFRRMKSQLAMLVVNIALTLLTFFLALLWAVNRYLRKPLGILTSATASISLDGLETFSVNTKTTRRNEIRILEEAINSMVLGLHKAIFEREDSQANLRVSEKKYRLLFERSNDAIFLVDIKSGKYLDANLAAEKLTGYSIDELKELTVHDVTPQGSAERLNLLKSKTEQTRFNTIEYIRPDGSKRIALLDIVQQKENIFFGIAHDITQSKHAEQELIKAKNAAEKSNKLKTEFLAQMSHEIRSPLNVIMSFIGLIKSEVEETISPDIEDSFQSIESASSRIIRTIDQYDRFTIRII